MELWAILTLLATVLAIVVAVMLEVTPGRGGGQSDSPTLTSSGSTASSTETEDVPSNGNSPVSEGAAHLQPGTCGGLEGEKFATVPCDAPHSAEVIPASTGCDVEDFARYAGGNPQVDVLRQDIRVLQKDGACFAEVPGPDLRQGFQDILRHESGTQLRECVDERSGEMVSCGENHTGEVVFREDPAHPSDLRCEERAEEYLGTLLQRHYRELRIVSTEGSPRRCVVEVRGANSLTDSLRSLGSKAVPIGPPY